MASELMELGVDPYEVSKKIYESEPANKIKLLGEVLNTLQITHEGKVASVVISREIFNRTNTTKQHTEGLINYPKSIEGVELAVLYRQEEDENKDENWKISLGTQISGISSQIIFTSRRSIKRAFSIAT